MYDGGICRFNKGVILRVASSVAKCLPRKCSLDFKSRVFGIALRISFPLDNVFSICWRPWRPTIQGNSCNLAFHVSDVRAVMSAIIRNFSGGFIFAIKVISSSKHFLKCLLHLMCEIRNSHISFVRLQTDHDDITLLGKDTAVDWTLFQLKRKLARDLFNVGILRVSFSLNKPAEALCFLSMDSLITDRFEDLPAAVQRALAHDDLPQPCSVLDQRVYV